MDLTDLGTAPSLWSNPFVPFSPVPGAPEDNHHYSLYKKHSFQEVLARHLMYISKFVKTEPHLWDSGSYKGTLVEVATGLLTLHLCWVAWKMAAWSYWPRNFLCLQRMEFFRALPLNYFLCPSACPEGSALLWHVTQRKREGTGEHFVVASAPVCPKPQSHHPLFLLVWLGNKVHLQLASFNQSFLFMGKSGSDRFFKWDFSVCLVLSTINWKDCHLGETPELGAKTLPGIFTHSLEVGADWQFRPKPGNLCVSIPCSLHILKGG